MHFEIEIAVLIGKPLSKRPCEEEVLMPFPVMPRRWI